MHTAHACVDHIYDASQRCAQIALKPEEKQARSVRVNLMLCPVYLHRRLVACSPSADTWYCDTNTVSG